MPRTILIIDDEPDLVKLLDYNLTKAGYAVLSASDGETGLHLARRHAPDALLLDIMLPGMDGWEVCRRIRQEPSTASILILMLTSKAEETDRVLGLELGADDYVSKPFSVRELLARVKALLRRADGMAGAAQVMRVGPIVVDSGRRRVTAGDRPVDLTATEFNLLRAFVQRPGRVLTREELIGFARGDGVVIFDRTVDVHIVALRRKLGKHGAWIETVRGVGYRLRE